MSLSARGVIVLIKEEEEVSSRFTKREFVLEIADNPMYPQEVVFQLAQQKVDLIDPYSEGEAVTVEFNLRGRRWNAPDGTVKFFNTLDAWRISPTSGAQEPKHYSRTIEKPSSPPPPPVPDKQINEAEEDDLPF